jgi:hypothetical protein
MIFQYYAYPDILFPALSANPEKLFEKLFHNPGNPFNFRLFNDQVI